MEDRIQGPMDMDMRTLRHDLRVPIANVIALAQMSMNALTGGSAQESILPYLSSILAAAQEMEQMTGETAGGDAARFTALELAQALSASVGAQAQEKHQLLRIDVSGLDGTMTGKQTAIKRILTNLLLNAVKYTPPGGHISLTARRRGDGEAEFVVEDDGMGMDEAFMARMFEPFARAQEAKRKGIPGQGLGLSIVRRMTQQLGGEISARSVPGKGTAFTLRLPLAMEAEGPAFEGMRFLLAEDNDLSAEIAAAILTAQGAQVRRAADGRQAVELFSGDMDGAFDAVLMDMHMPGMDGCAAAKAIRDLDRARAKSIPILALTAGGGAQDEKEALAAGMNGCMSKPLDVEALRLAMGEGERWGRQGLPPL